MESIFTALQKCKVSLHIAFGNNLDITLIYNTL